MSARAPRHRSQEPVPAQPPATVPATVTAAAARQVTSRVHSVMGGGGREEGYMTIGTAHKRTGRQQWAVLGALGLTAFPCVLLTPNPHPLLAPIEMPANAKSSTPSPFKVGARPWPWKEDLLPAASHPLSRALADIFRCHPRPPPKPPSPPPPPPFRCASSATHSSGSLLHSPPLKATLLKNERLQPLRRRGTLPPQSLLHCDVPVPREPPGIQKRHHKPIRVPGHSSGRDSHQGCQGSH